jgi:hypothetical protein
MTNEQNIAEPEGLSKFGADAHREIMRVLDRHGCTDAGGCKAFYSPEEWRSRGEQYGLRAELIVVYDGGEFREFFSMDACYANARPGIDCYAPMETMRKALERVGLFAEECTGWYAAIYNL